MKSSNLSDHAIEWAVLDMAMARPSAVEDMHDLAPDMFWGENHRQIFEAIMALTAEGKQVSIMTVYDTLKQKGHDHAASAAIEQVGQNPSFTYAIKPMVERLIDLWRKRAIDKMCRDTAQTLEGPCNTENILGKLQKDMEGICRIVGRKEKKFGDQGLGLDRFRAPEGYCLTGIGELDRHITGLFNSHLIIIAGRTSNGKTSLAMNIARRNLAGEGKILFFSLETLLSEIEMRLLIAESGVESDKILMGTNAGDTLRLKDAQDYLLKDAGNLLVYDNIFDLYAIAREARRQALNNRLKMIVVDYLQLISVPGVKEKRLQVEEASRTMKLLAMELNVPVICLSQLSRIPDGEEPKLYHLRESGAIEQDANVVLFVHSDKESMADYIIVAKSKLGKVGKVRCQYKRSRLTFYDEGEA